MNKIKLFFIIIFIFFLNKVNFVFSQTNQFENYSKNYKIPLSTHTGWSEHIRTNKFHNKKKTQFSLSYHQILYINTNLPNTENQDGHYYPKGFGSFSFLKLEYDSKYLYLSTTPSIKNSKIFNIDIPEKSDVFSVLNDTKNNKEPNTFLNTGFQFHLKGLSFGYGNWNQWWGPGIHNSLVMTNNAEGFYHYFIGTSNYIKIANEIYLYAKYITSQRFENILGEDFFLSSLFLNIKYKIFDIGYSRNILSGGYPGLKWSNKDAFLTLFNKTNINYWDIVNDYYIYAEFPESDLQVFIEIGIPNRSFGNKDPSFYQDHTIGRNIGVRKKNIFGSKNMLIGFEYSRLVQSVYYNIMPSSNWYDNNKFNFSSYNNRRWASHSGSDSDDLLIFIGLINENKSIIYGMNYERHGVTFAFPPEVKFESRLAINYMIKNTKISLYLENEYFEHYGFVDDNNNVWNNTFENGSIQRTKTIIFSIDQVII